MKIYMKKILILVLSTGVFIFLLGTAYYFRNHKMFISYRGSIAEFCSKKENKKGNGSGEVFIIFKAGMGPSEVRNYLRTKGYHANDEWLLSESRQLLLSWTPNFIKQLGEIQVKEVNDFLNSIRKDPNVKDVYIPRLWRSDRMDAMTTVNQIDRLGYFYITLRDLSYKEEFFQKFREATQVVSSTQGNRIMISYKLYDLQKVLENVKQKIIESTGGEDSLLKSRYGEVGSAFLNTEHEAKIGIYIPREYSRSEISNILSTFEEIDLKNTVKTEFDEAITIVVPQDEEFCWADQLKKEEEVSSAFAQSSISTF